MAIPAVALGASANTAEKATQSIMDFLAHSGGIGVTHTVTQHQKHKDVATTYKIEIKGWELGVILLGLGSIYLSEITIGEFKSFDQWLMDLAKKLGTELNPQNLLGQAGASAQSWLSSLENSFSNDVNNIAKNL
jgi:hypothetical protein